MKTSVVIKIGILVSLTAVVGCSISHQVRRVKTVNPTSQPGIYYHLPETVLRVEAPVKKTTKDKGELGKLLENLKDSDFKMAEIEFKTIKSIEAFLGGIPKEKTVKFSIEEAKIVTRARPDQNAMFVVGLHDDSGSTARGQVNAAPPSRQSPRQAWKIHRALQEACGRP